MHIGSLDEAALRLTLVVLCNQRINQFKRQSQTCKQTVDLTKKKCKQILKNKILTQGLSSKLTVANLVGSSIRPRGKLDNWLELRDLEKKLNIFLKIVKPKMLFVVLNIFSDAR